MMYRDTMTGKILIDFMSRLRKDAGGKVFLILDNLRAHHGKKVKKWLENHKEEIAVFYLPSYSRNSTPMNISMVILKPRYTPAYRLVIRMSLSIKHGHL